LDFKKGLLFDVGYNYAFNISAHTIFQFIEQFGVQVYYYNVITKSHRHDIKNYIVLDTNYRGTSPNNIIHEGPLNM